jgi:hypothetical protein
MSLPPNDVDGSRPISEFQSKTFNVSSPAQIYLFGHSKVGSIRRKMSSTVWLKRGRLPRTIAELVENSFENCRSSPPRAAEGNNAMYNRW